MESIRKRIEARRPIREKVSTSIDLPLAQDSKRALKYAAEEAERLLHEHIGSEHLLLGLIREEKCFAAELLREFGLDLYRVRHAIASQPVVSRQERQAYATSADLHRARAGLVRKSQTMSAMFHWEKQQCMPRDALVKRLTGQVMLYTGQAYDAVEFDVAKDGWTHDYCVACWKMLYLPDEPERSFGYTNGQCWLCAECYKAFVESNPE